MYAGAENAANKCQKLDRSTRVIFGPVLPRACDFVFFLYGELSGVTGHPNAGAEEADGTRCRPIAKTGSEVAEINQKHAASPDT
jgi:hypothetical protein